MKDANFQIIYLNGPSSSGKTTLAKALQHAFEEPFLHVGVDKIIGWMPEKINDWTGGEAPLGYSWKKTVDESGNPIQELQAGPFAKKIGATFREVVLALAKMGHYLIIDDVSFGKQQVDEWKEALKGFSVLWVGVNAPLSILEQREKERGNRILGSARGQFHKVHVDITYDLEVDTHHATLNENTAKIKSYILSNPEETSLMKISDVEAIVATFCFPWTTQEKTLEKWARYSSEHQKKIRTVYLLKSANQIIGYGSLLRKSEYPPFRKAGIPEINDIWVSDEWRGKGLGTKLILHLENIARKEGCLKIGLGVGLYKDYGVAQALYCKLGYVPDGQGITYKTAPIIPGTPYPIDDDLILWLTKPIAKIYDL